MFRGLGRAIRRRHKPTWNALALVATKFRVTVAGVIEQAFKIARRLLTIAGRVREPAWSKSIRFRLGLDNWPSQAENLVDWRGFNLRAVMRPELCQPALQRFCLQQPFRPVSDENDPRYMLDLSHACVDAAQTCTLVRALSWVRRGSSNDRAAHAAVLECVASIHVARTSESDQSRLWKPHFLSSMIAICPIDTVAVLDVIVDSTFFQLSGDYMSLRLHSQAPFRAADVVAPFIKTIGRERLRQQFLPLCQVWESDHIAYEVCHSLIHSDLLSLVDD